MRRVLSELRVSREPALHKRVHTRLECLPLRLHKMRRRELLMRLLVRSLLLSARFG